MTESELTAAALALSEQRSSAAQIRDDLRQGRDPLGEAFTLLRTPELRRVSGATYTPASIVDAMANWALSFSGDRHPSRVVDPGAGSARFLMAAGRRFPDAQLIGVEVDPLAALIARANLAACGYADRSRIILADYRSVRLPPEDGRTLYIGNRIRRALRSSSSAHRTIQTVARSRSKTSGFPRQPTGGTARPLLPRDRPPREGRRL